MSDLGYWTRQVGWSLMLTACCVELLTMTQYVKGREFQARREFAQIAHAKCLLTLLTVNENVKYRTKK